MTMNLDSRELDGIRRDALALVNRARADVGAGEIADFPQGDRFTTDDRHPLVAALWPCGARGIEPHIDETFLVCADIDVAVTLASLWSPPGAAVEVTEGATFALRTAGREALWRFDLAFNNGRYPDLIAPVADAAEVA